jgi:hypothetical protein
MSARSAIAALALALWLCAPAASAATERAPALGDRLADGITPPPAGLYDARLCVAVGAAPANCGPVAVDLGDDGLALVRISDVVYRLQMAEDHLGVSLFHGTMQIDGFVTRYQWTGGKLLFRDPEKGARYELQIGTRRFAAP